MFSLLLLTSLKEQNKNIWRDWLNLMFHTLKINFFSPSTTSYKHVTGAEEKRILIKKSPRLLFNLFKKN